MYVKDFMKMYLQLEKKKKKKKEDRVKSDFLKFRETHMARFH